MTQSAPWRFPCNHQKTRVNLFLAALFKIAANWKQSKYPSTGESINIIRYYSAIKTITDIHNNMENLPDMLREGRKI